MRTLFAALLLAGAAAPAMLCQQAPAMPSWLVTYPDADAQTRTFPALAQATYSTPAAPGAVSEHYRKLFESANVPFRPSSDGIGTVIRGAAAECDLMIAIRAQNGSTRVEVNCAANSSPAETWTAVPGSGSTTSSRPSFPRSASARPSSAQAEAARQQALANLPESQRRMLDGLTSPRIYEDAPAPPLVWPAWLVSMKGGKLAIQRGVDNSKREYLKATFVTSTPMTAIFTHYEDLLNVNDYRVHNSRLETGQTISGIAQNANGYVEGSNYPSGNPGPYTAIHVSFRRSNLNDPITVELRITAFPYEGLKRRF